MQLAIHSHHLPHSMKFPFRGSSADSPPLTDLSNGSNEREKRGSYQDESTVPWVTWRSALLGAFVSIGGIIFGYDTGQISGFLEMRNYKQRFAQLKPNGKYEFSTVRSGLIVSMVSGLEAQKNIISDTLSYQLAP